MEKIVKHVNEGIYSITKKSSKSGIGQKFKFDMTKDGKLDVTFVRFDCSEKKMKRKTGGDWSGKCKLSKYNYWSNFLKLNGFNNPKKIYVNFLCITCFFIFVNSSQYILKKRLEVIKYFCSKTSLLSF